jgi:ribosomal protein L11 methyltransferase
LKYPQSDPPIDHAAHLTGKLQQKITVTLSDRDLARRVASALSDLIEPGPDALTIFEEPPAGVLPDTLPDGTFSGFGSLWRVDAYYEEMPDPAELAAQVAALLEIPAPNLIAEDVPNENWVELSQAALPPVVAGRFTVHGSHDVANVPQGPNSILIDAGEAFGTAHHQTTYGCLVAIDELTRRQEFRSILDLGCGSGLLAIALARVLPHAQITASDIDATSVDVASANMKANGVGRRIKCVVAAGFAHKDLRGHELYDLIVANILAGPLIMLAPDMARAAKPGATVVLSGLLENQAAEVLAAYTHLGFIVRQHKRITGWSTLVLLRRG